MLMVGRFHGGPLGRQLNNGHETYNINHRNLKKRVVAAGKDFVLVYKSHPGLMRLYKEYNIILLNKFGKVTTSMELAEEMIVTTLKAPTLS